MSQWAHEHPEQMAEIAALPPSQQNEALRAAIGYDPDAIRDRYEEQQRDQLHGASESRGTPAGEDRVPTHVPPRLAGTYDDEGDCTVCGAPVGKHHLSYCDLRGDV